MTERRGLLTKNSDKFQEIQRIFSYFFQIFSVFFRCKKKKRLQYKTLSEKERKKYMKKRWKAAWISVFAAAAIAVQLFVFPFAQVAGTPTAFTFSDSLISVTQGDYDGYKTEGTALTINQSGIYSLSGTCSDGSVTVKKGQRT